MTELAIKKLDRFTNTDHCEREQEFIEKFIYIAPTQIEFNQGLSIENLIQIADRCHKFKGRIIGIETNPNSEYSLFVFCWEDYCDTYSPDWVWNAYMELLINNVENCIIPIMDFPSFVLDQY